MNNVSSTGRANSKLGTKVPHPPPRRLGQGPTLVSASGKGAPPPMPPMARSARPSLPSLPPPNPPPRRASEAVLPSFSAEPSRPLLANLPEPKLPAPPAEDAKVSLPPISPPPRPLNSAPSLRSLANGTSAKGKPAPSHDTLVDVPVDDDDIAEVDVDELDIVEDESPTLIGRSASEAPKASLPAPSPPPRPASARKPKAKATIQGIGQRHETPMALDWDDEEDSTAVYERDEPSCDDDNEVDSVRSAAKVVVDDSLATDEGPTLQRQWNGQSRAEISVLGDSVSPGMSAPSDSVSEDEAETTKPAEVEQAKATDGPSSKPATMPIIESVSGARLAPPPRIPAALPPPPRRPSEASLGGDRHAVTSVSKRPSSISPVVSTSSAPRSVRGGRKGPFALGALAALGAAAAAGFLLVPSHGDLHIDVKSTSGQAVERAEVFVDGKKVCDALPCVARDVRTGEAVVRAVVPGYTDSVPVTTVVSRGDNNAVVSVTPALGSISVAAAPTGVRVLVDGADRGSAPLELSDLRPGSHTIRLEGGDRYAPLEKTIEVVAGETVSLDDLRLDVVKGQLTLDLQTDGARVTLEDVSEGRTKSVRGPWPQSIEVDGERTWLVKAEKKGFVSFEKRIDFESGRAEQTIDIALVSETQTNEEPEADKKASTSSAVASSPKKESVSSSKPAKEEADKPAEKPTSTTPGTLNVNSIPVSRVLVDGADMGQTPRVDISLPSGMHTVTFVHPELGRKSVTVNIKAGQTSTAAVKLRD